MQEYTKEQNDYALKNGKIIYILDAPRFSKGYICPGCRENMLPVRAQIEDRKSYFRHEPKDVNSIRKCTYSNSEYRRILAMDILARIKRIKVPNLYKYAPDGKSKKLLIESHFVDANSVKADLFYYENEDGIIKYDKNKNLEENILFKADITFFNNQDLPILLIKFVENYKTSEDEKANLIQLGIDTIKIIIPKDSEESIANSFYTSTISKWIYNGTEQRTNYLQLSSRNTEPTSGTDELENRIFEETYACRSSQINNLIRKVGKCLGSERYHRIKQLFEQEISRIENATREHRARLDEIQARIESEVNAELGDRILAIGQQREKFQSDKADLEKRYLTKREKLTREQENLDREVQYRYGIRESESSIRDRFRTVEERLGNDFERELSTIGRDIVCEKSIIKDYRGHEQRIQREIEKDTAFESEFGKIEDNLKQEFERLESEEQQYFEIEKGKLHSGSKDFGQVRKELDDRIRDEFEGRYQQIVERINKRDVQGGDELSERIANVLQVRGHLDGYQRDITRIEQAKRIIQDGAYKKWD